jgi:hypothetical protein
MLMPDPAAGGSGPEDPALLPLELEVAEHTLCLRIPRPRPARPAWPGPGSVRRPPPERRRAGAPSPTAPPIGVRCDPLLPGPRRGHHPPGAGTGRRRRGGRHRRRVAGRPAAPAACSRWTARGCAARPLQATRCTCWQRWTTTTGPCSPSATGPQTPTRSRCWATAGRPRPCRCGRHRRCAGHPTRPRQLSHRPRRRLPAGRRGQPASPARPARRAAVAADPVMDRTREHAHGRIEIRTLKVAAVAGLCFPPRRPGNPGHSPRPRAGQPPLARRHRLRRHQPDPRQRQPCSWPAGCAGTGGSRTGCTGPRHDLRRRRLHRAHRQPPPGDGQPAQPLAVGALRLAGHPNLAAALRHTGRDPARPLMILGWTHSP